MVKQSLNWRRIRTWMINTLYVQLFLTLISWPILLFWGLPLSVLTIVGNVCFSPVIALFLGISLCIFFCTLFGLPCALFVWALEVITHAWLWIISWASKKSLFACIKPSVALLVCMPLVALGIVYGKWGKTQYKGAVVQAGFFIFLCVLLKFFLAPRSASYPVACGGGQLLTGRHNGLVFLADPEGVLRNGTHLRSWIDFTLRSHFTQRLGASACDVCIIAHPTKSRLAAAITIARALAIEIIVIPRGQGDCTSVYSVVNKSKRLLFVSVDPEVLKDCFIEGKNVNYGQLTRVLNKLLQFS